MSAYVICCNGHPEHVVMDCPQTAQEKLDELSRQYYDANFRHFLSEDKYAIAVTWRIKEVDYSYRNKHPGARGIRHARAVHPFETVQLARELHGDGAALKVIAKRLGVDYHTVCDWVYFKTRRYE